MLKNREISEEYIDILALWQKKNVSFEFENSEFTMQY